MEFVLDRIEVSCFAQTIDSGGRQSNGLRIFSVQSRYLCPFGGPASGVMAILFDESLERRAGS